MLPRFARQARRRCLISLPLLHLVRPVLSFSLLPTSFAHSSAPFAQQSVSMSSTSTPSTEDPYSWLEEVEADECLEFAKSANAKCLEALGDPKNGEAKTYEKVLGVLESEDRIPYPSNYGLDEKGDRVMYNFWKDKDHPKGIWRKTTLSEYKANAKPNWDLVLDVDALAEKDGVSWVWKGSRALPRARDPISEGRIVTRALLNLSRGGMDAIHVKEFDLLSGSFVEEDPFNLPEAKTRASYKSRNVLMVGTDLGPDSLTDSGYPRTVREWVRGTKVEDAPVIFEGEKTDIAVGAYVSDQRKFGGGIWQLHYRSINFYETKYVIAKLDEEHLLAPQERTNDALESPKFQDLDIQADANPSIYGNMMTLLLRSDWTPKEGGATYKTGSLIYCDINKFLAEGKEACEYTVLFEPSDRTAYEYYTCTKNYLLLSTMHDVKSKLEFYKLDEGAASVTLIGGDKVPRIRDCSAWAVDSTDSDEFWFSTSDYITPTTLCLADATKVEGDEAASAENGDDDDDLFVTDKLRSLPEMYDSTGLKVEQRMATSKDGTQVPYFIVMKEDVELNGKNPTLLYGYGGFEVSLGPHYVASTGLSWLERGGVYIEANIRGGGEFGPSWHQAGLKENRNKCYEDFIAVAEHLIESKICTPKTLAARGGSNGGLLMGNMYTMAPELFGAIHCAVPLLDMKRFNTLLAGASWMAEYGNPDTDDWDNFLHKYSPYHNIDINRESYPPILFTTSTKDDRVHPAHARKMVKKLWDLGEGKEWPVYYYENIEGGHGGAADAKQSAFMTSLAHDFMFDTLTKNAEKM